MLKLHSHRNVSQDTRHTSNRRDWIECMKMEILKLVSRGRYLKLFPTENFNGILNNWLPTICWYTYYVKFSRRSFTSHLHNTIGTVLRHSNYTSPPRDHEVNWNGSRGLWNVVNRESLSCMLMSLAAENVERRDKTTSSRSIYYLAKIGLLIFSELLWWRNVGQDAFA